MAGKFTLSKINAYQILVGLSFLFQNQLDFDKIRQILPQYEVYECSMVYTLFFDLTKTPSEAVRICVTA